MPLVVASVASAFVVWLVCARSIGGAAALLSIARLASRVRARNASGKLMAQAIARMRAAADANCDGGVDVVGAAFAVYADAHDAGDADCVGDDADHDNADAAGSNGTLGEGCGGRLMSSANLYRSELPRLLSLIHI